MATGAVAITPDTGPIAITPDPPPPSLIDRGNELAGKALSNAGLPTSISNIPDWFAHFIGAAKDSKPAWDAFKTAVENPTQENMVGAVPFIGPASVAMSNDAKKGDYLGSLADLAGVVGSVVAGKEVGPGLTAAKTELAETLRTPEGKLTPAAKAAARTVAGAVGGTVGHALGGEGGVAGTLVGASSGLGPSLADMLVPNRPVRATPFGAYEEPVSPVLGPDTPTEAQFKRSAKIAAASADVAPSVNKPTATLKDMAATSEGRPATWTNDTVRQLAAWGDEDAIQQAKLRGFGTVPKNYSTVDLNPRSVTKFDASGNPIVEGQSADNFAYRVRNQGEEGVPIGGSKSNAAHATTTLDDAQRIQPGRESVTGEPQEIVKYDLSKLKEGTDYVRVQRPGQPDWIRMLRPLKENEVQLVRQQ